MKQLTIILLLICSLASGQQYSLWYLTKKQAAQAYSLYAGTTGTSPYGKLLVSDDDGASWDTLQNNLGSYLGITGLYKTTSNDVIYCTLNSTNSVMANLTDNVSKSVYAAHGKDIVYFNDSIFVSTGNVNRWKQGVGDFSNVWSAATVNKFLKCGDSLLLITASGIYKYPKTTYYQSGNFTCGVYDDANGYAYCAAGTHVYKNNSANNFSAWTDLGDKTMGGGSITSICINGSRIHYTSGAYYWYTDNGFTNVNFTGYSASSTVVSIISYENIVISGSNNGHIGRSTNNGDTWNDLGQQFSQTSINCILKY